MLRLDCSSAFSADRGDKLLPATRKGTKRIRDNVKYRAVFRFRPSSLALSRLLSTHSRENSPWSCNVPEPMSWLQLLNDAQCHCFGFYGINSAGSKTSTFRTLDFFYFSPLSRLQYIVFLPLKSLVMNTGASSRWSAFRLEWATLVDLTCYE